MGVHTMGFMLGGQANVQRLWCCGMRSELSMAFQLGTVCGDAVHLHHVCPDTACV